MRRIGLAASKMAQGNLFKYNLFVVAIACLFSVFLFLVSGFTVLAVLLLISVLMRAFAPADFSGSWGGLIKMSMLALAVVIGLLNTAAIVKNIKIGKKKI